MPRQSPTDGNAMADEQFIIFRLGDQEYGIPIAAVDEIARPPDHITRLPKAPAFIDGVMNLRGSVVPIVDLRRRFDLTSTEPGERPAHSRAGDRRGEDGFPGRQRLGSHEGARPMQFMPAPELSPEQMRLISRVANLDAQGRMILLVDPAQLLDQVEADVLAKFDRSDLEHTVEGFVIKLLIADDSALMRKLLEGIFLEEGDFDIRSGPNGDEALELVRSFDPQVVTLDVQMPGMDGLTCLGRIMIEAPRPVVMISSLTEEGAEATLEAIELGAVDFIAKPGGTVSLEIDRLRPLLVEKVRCAATVRIRRTLRLTERVRHQIPRSWRCAATPATAHLSGKRRRSVSGTGADRHLDRRTGGARYCAPAIAGRLFLAGAGRPALAGEFHRSLCQATRPRVRAAGRRGAPPDAAEGGDDLHR